MDGETWEQYWQDLEARLADLQDRVHRGSNHPQPVRRAYIEKADGRERPLGIPAVEDKILQSAVRMLLEPVYENGAFLGYSYPKMIGIMSLRPPAPPFAGRRGIG